MTKELFDAIFEGEILPFVKEIQENNSKIKIKDLEECKREIYREYEELNASFKEVIFGKETVNLLDRHKVAACMCGAFLRVSVFNKQALIDEIKRTKMSVEALFFYVNELVAFCAGSKFLAFFMGTESRRKGNAEKAVNITTEFPILPKVKQSSRGCYSNLLFYLSRIKDDAEIGLEHYDKYAYSMYFYMLEEYYDKIWNERKEHACS